MEAQQVPLIELLEKVPANARLEIHDPDGMGTKFIPVGKMCHEAITALRAAIEQAQEPVAWMHNLIEGNVITHRPADIDRHPERWTALYTAPPPCQTCEALARSVMMDQTSHDMAPRQWQGLTDEEIKIIWRDIDGSEGMLMRFARAIEAKLKEKNT